MHMKPTEGSVVAVNKLQLKGKCSWSSGVNLLGVIPRLKSYHTGK